MVSVRNHNLKFVINMWYPLTILRIAYVSDKIRKLYGKNTQKKVNVYKPITLCELKIIIIIINIKNIK